jgi:hypothetical protein
MKRPLLTTFFLLASMIAFSAFGSGCATQHVQAWERGTLSDYTMRPDRDGLATAMAEHTYFSRESSSGGRGVGGSGCGCN